MEKEISSETKKPTKKFELDEDDIDVDNYFEKQREIEKNKKL